MSRFTGGWIKLHRSLGQKDIAQNAMLLSVWVYLLVIANYKESQIIWCGKQRLLQPGECLIKMRELSEKWECSPSTIWKWFHYLRDTGRIAIDARTHGTIVTICNWKEYQIEEEEVRTPSEHDANTTRTRRERGVDYSEEVKKERREERKNVGIRTDYPEDFNQLWIKYGKRGDKKAAFEEYKLLQLQPQEIIQLDLAITHYCQANEFKFRLHFCRFLKTDWRETSHPLTNGHTVLTDQEKKTRGLTVNESPNNPDEFNQRMKDQLQ